MKSISIFLMLIFGLVTHSQSKIIKEEKIENKYINPKDTLELVVSKYVYVTTYEEEYNYPVPFSITDKPPIFPGCLGSEDELKSCFFSKLNKHILDNQVYPEGAKEENISVKIFVYFEIDKSGVVSNIKVRDLNVEFKEEFIKEGKRLIQELPIFEPGIKDGNIIITSLTVPITFKM